MWSGSTAQDGDAINGAGLEGGPMPLMRLEFHDGTQCVISAVNGVFEVHLLRDGAVVQVSRFSVPGPAFDTAHSRRGDELGTSLEELPL
jgi:hypothetical protein